MSYPFDQYMHITGGCNQLLCSKNEMTGFGNNCVFEKIQKTKQVLSPLNCAREVAVINLSLWFLYIF